MNLMSLTAVELGKKIKSGEVTAVDATKRHWSRSRSWMEHTTVM